MIEQPESVQREISRLIRECAESEIQLTPSDFCVGSDGSLSLDGMDAEQWVDAVTMP